jgi:hypothetical protein
MLYQMVLRYTLFCFTDILTTQLFVVILVCAGDSLSSEDICHGIDALPDYITARFTRLTRVQEKAVKQKVQHIDSESPIFVVEMQKTNVSGRFTVVSSLFYSLMLLPLAVRSCI